MLGMACFCGCGKKGEYKGYVHVTQAEAETFAEQLIAKFKQGDKQPFYDFGTDMDAVEAFHHLSSPNKKQGTLNAEQRKVVADSQAMKNHLYFDSLMSVEFVEVKEQLGSPAVVIDCKFDKTFKLMNKEQKFALNMVKKKDSGEIVVVFCF